MRKALLRPALAGLLLSAFLATGCGNDSSGPDPTVDLSGSYTLQSLTESGFTLAPPTATGTLGLTSSNYVLDMTIEIPGQQAEQLHDAGTYTISGSKWTQASATSGVQSVGTYTFNSGVLTVDVTTQGQALSTTWLKQ